MAPETIPILKLSEILAAEGQEIEEKLAVMEARRPGHLTPIEEQMKFGVEAARLRGMSEMIVKIYEKVEEFGG